MTCRYLKANSGLSNYRTTFRITESFKVSVPIVIGVNNNEIVSGSAGLEPNSSKSKILKVKKYYNIKD